VNETNREVKKKTAKRQIKKKVGNPDPIKAENESLPHAPDHHHRAESSEGVKKTITETMGGGSPERKTTGSPSLVLSKLNPGRGVNEGSLVKLEKPSRVECQSQ